MEKYTGKNNKSYHVFPYTRSKKEREAALMQVAKENHTKPEYYTIITVWVDDEGLYLNDLYEGEKMLEVVKR